MNVYNIVINASISHDGWVAPCPFCGEEMNSVTVEQGSTPRWRRVVGCCADGPEIRHDTMNQDQLLAETESSIKAIKAWNTRNGVELKGS